MCIALEGGATIVRKDGVRRVVRGSAGLLVRGSGESGDTKAMSERRSDGIVRGFVVLPFHVVLRCALVFSYMHWIESKIYEVF